MRTSSTASRLVLFDYLATMLTFQQVRASPTDSVNNRYLWSGLTIGPLRSRMPPIDPASLPTNLEDLIKLGKANQAAMKTANDSAEQALENGDTKTAESYGRMAYEASQNVQLMFDRYEQLVLESVEKITLKARSVPDQGPSVLGPKWTSVACKRDRAVASAAPTRAKVTSRDEPDGLDGCGGADANNEARASKHAARMRSSARLQPLVLVDETGAVRRSRADLGAGFGIAVGCSSDEDDEGAVNAEVDTEADVEVDTEVETSDEGIDGAVGAEDGDADVGGEVETEASAVSRRPISCAERRARTDALRVEAGGVKML
ncbi:hypothetical protein V8E36_009847 [Tilletia maclaganii]